MSDWVRTHSRARKEHICTLCRRTIAPGEVYMRGVGFDGGAWTWKECAHCEAFFTFINDHFGEYEYSADLANEWQARTLAELRVKVQWLKRWTRGDGALYPLPEVLREERATVHGRPYTTIAGIKPGAEPEEGS